MTLYWPPKETEINASDPRLHVLVIGVGDYLHYEIGAPAPATFLNGIGQLTTTPPAARRIARFFETEYNNPDRPLGSIELVLSPSEQLTRDDGSIVAIEEATMENIKTAFDRWYKRCDSHEDNVALFYFAGHGISHGTTQYLLASDFGDPSNNDEWENCIDAESMKAGMYKCAADIQLFFFDACRNTPIDALTQSNPHGQHLVTSSQTDKVSLSVAYRAASEGLKAYGKDNEETYFCKALMMCLEGVGASKPGPDWRVDTAMLSSSMAAVIDVMARAENQPLSCELPAMRPFAFHYPVGPRVVIKLDCIPDAIREQASAQLTQGQKVMTGPNDGGWPWVDRADAGKAKIEVNFDFLDDEVLDVELFAPVFERDVER